ncbi:Planctomycete cytochrome C [Singulisphaera sp. GP187]|uniref:PSD1 and planctomycete cytochrome C domain-containing protein n=1 Tax=Singulisphaera sp. GP187 TaxID=1882752 RepID=UPI0009289987|nr:PSD1 and planctomycete cytochrome C domain-containing protein [Singulisphaera sp. GP187]SIO65036.1 Planctomycete cytochrome C [Singulisphaera sp. GP187]
MRILGATLLILVTTHAGLAARADQPLTFERDVRPILKAYCLDCHGGGEQLKGKLDLRLKRFAVRGGATGPALVPGRPDESELLARVRDGEMPPGDAKVPADRVAVLEKWIAAGAPTAREEPESLPQGIDITPEDRAFWAFQPIRRLDPPQAGPDDRVRTPIDAFVLARLRDRGLGFAPDADRRTLIRRVHADLTGLPPTPEEVDAFVADPAPDAYERLVDRLLASPHYGERWARHWLDAAGYADSEGDGTQDTPRQFAYKYRDYVIRALNADTPFDRFLIEQVAGDELVPKPWANLSPEQTQLLAATGFLRTAPDGTATGGADALVSNQVVTDTIKIVGSAVLGLTVACAQCHDHRYDPIPQSDYYRFRAVFEPALDPQHWRQPGQRLISLYSDANRARATAVEAEAQAIQKELDAKTARFLAAATVTELSKFPEDVRGKLRAALDAPADKRTDEQKSLLATNPSVNISAGVLYQYDPKAADELKKDAERIAAKRSEKPPEDFVSVLDEVPGVAPETHLFHRGDYRQPKSPVGPGDLTIAAPDGQRYEIPPDDPTLPTTGRRLAYARHLVNGRHPLVGRVLVNRLWLHHFGRGLVETPGDFGALGTRPTHPELLDWLADDVARGGWGLKRMHRLILTSTAYRQSSRRAPAQDAVDIENALYGRYAVRRLDAEAFRDNVLAVSGRLDRTPFGPSVPVAEDSVGQVLPDKDSPRRSVYLQARRTKPVSLLSAFDAPVMAINCDRRVLSTSAPQALVLMNSEFTLGHAKSMAQRLRAEAPANSATDSTDPAANRLPRMIAHAWLVAYQRPVSREELDAAVAFVAVPRGGDDPELAALTDLCQQLLCSNEFLYVD